jgi:hypothetical protein
MSIKVYLYVIIGLIFLDILRNLNHIKGKEYSNINYDVNGATPTVTLYQVETLKTNADIDKMRLGLLYDFVFLIAIGGVLFQLGL